MITVKGSFHTKNRFKIIPPKQYKGPQFLSVSAMQQRFRYRRHRQNRWQPQTYIQFPSKPLTRDKVKHHVPDLNLVSNNHVNISFFPHSLATVSNRIWPRLGQKKLSNLFAMARESCKLIDSEHTKMYHAICLWLVNHTDEYNQTVSMVSYFHVVCQYRKYKYDDEQTTDKRLSTPMIKYKLVDFFKSQTVLLELTNIRHFKGIAHSRVSYY